MPHLDAEVEISAKRIEEALQRPGDFGLSSEHRHYQEMFQTWSLGPVIQHRDSDLLTQSNADALLRHLGSDPSLAEDWVVTNCGHWAVGWVDHLSFRAVEEDGKTPTRIFRVLEDWFEKLSDYPVADDEDYSRRQHEASFEAFEETGRRWTKDDAPKDWADRAWEWLRNDGIEPRQGDDGIEYFQDEEIKRALKELGFLEPEEGEEDDGAEDPEG